MIAGAIRSLLGGGDVVLTTGRLAVPVKQRDDVISRLPPAQAKQAEEVLGRIRAAGGTGGRPLALEAVLSRFVPAAPAASNVQMMDSEKYWKRFVAIEEAQGRARAAAVNAPVSTEKASKTPIPDDAVKLLRDAKKVAWVLGAGVSAAAGIAPYRGVGGQDDVHLQRARTLQFYMRHSDICWVYVAAMRRFLDGKSPTAAHQSIARMVARGGHKVITQNVDGLEARAGFDALAIHGRIQEFHCVRENVRKQARDTRYNDESFPICADCGSLLKPGMVFFGEGIPQAWIEGAVDEVLASDLLIEVGTSHTVAPVSNFHRLAKKRGVKTILINIDEAIRASPAQCHLVGDAQQIVPGLERAAFGA